MSDDTPTERFEAPSAAATVGEGGKKKSKLLILILSIVGGLLLIAVVVLLTLLLSRGIGGPSAEPVSDVSTSPSASSSETPSESPSASPSETPSESPSASPSSAPPPPPPPPQETGPRFKTLNYPSSQSCSAGGPSFPATRPTFTVSWSTAGADEAWFVNGTDDAANSGYMQIPLNGNQGDFPYEQIVDCSDGSNTYTITLVGPDGKHVSKTWTVTITGDHF
ncbi:hypothetical protein GCM10022239_16660 [Leifsonia bigeumensis]|uniref:Uncharacterized protein n=1 Tax=Leifsonella bigeumensis TaxID=433643 RepID=A0ABP7FJQ2_9MICO